MRKAKWIVCGMVLAAAGTWIVAGLARPAPEPEQEQRVRFEREWRRIMQDLSRTRPGEYDRILHYPDNWDEVVR